MATASPRRARYLPPGWTGPFGIAFYPPGPEPKYVYVGNTGSVVRFPYQNGDLRREGGREIVKNIPTGREQVGGGGHWTRDLRVLGRWQDAVRFGRLAVERQRR